MTEKRKKYDKKKVDYLSAFCPKIAIQMKKKEMTSQSNSFSADCIDVLS
jgi:hypothetical protein